MSISQNKSGGVRLGTQLRGKLAAAYAARGHLTSKLAYVYSPRAKKDVVLASNLEFWHFVLAESDSNICSADYNPDKEIVSVADDVHGTVLDAVIKLKDGTIEWREIKYSDDDQPRTKHQWEAQAEAAHRSGAIYRRFTEKEIFSKPQRLSNWVEVIAWLSAVRDRPTLEYDLAVQRLLQERDIVTIADLQSQGGTRPLGACYVAAAFRMLQEGACFSDLDLQPLTPNTLISLAEVG